MNQDSLDDIFKSGLSGGTFTNKEANWNKLEQQLNADKRRRPLVWLLLAAVFTTGALLYVYNRNTTNKTFAQQPSTKAGQLAANPGKELANNTVQSLETEAANSSAVTSSPVASRNMPTPVNGSSARQQAAVQSSAAAKTDNPYSAVSIISGTTQRNASKRSSKATAIMQVTSAAPDEWQAISASQTYPEKVMGDLSLIKTSLRGQRNAGIAAKPMLPANLLTSNTGSKTMTTPQKRYSIEVVAGSDIFHLNKQVGYYAGLRIVRHLDNGSAISVGANYSYNSMSEKYRLADKPFQQQQETDAQLNSMRMLRFPIMFQRRFANSKFSLMAGLTPSYILGASVYNIPPSVTPTNPADYRQFTIKDMNRFNILFGAGVKYAFTQRLGFELSGSYGFTELVKNSYINQSNVNGNFRNIQAGLILKLK